MNCVNVSPCLSAYPPIVPSRSVAPVPNLVFPASLSLNKSSSIYTVAGLRKFSLKAEASTSRYQQIAPVCLPKFSPKAEASTSKYQQIAPVCLFGGKKSGSGDQAAPKEALDNFLGSFKKEPSIEDLLRQQIQKQEFFDDGGTGSGGLGGGGGGSGGSGGSEDENTPDDFDEIFQVTMATLGFVYMYIYILRGEEIGRYFIDVIRYYVFRGRKSIRLTKLIAKWSKKSKIIKRKLMPLRLPDELRDELESDMLGHVIRKTETMFYSPPKKAPKKVEKQAKVDPVYGEEYYEEDDDEYYY